MTETANITALKRLTAKELTKRAAKCRSRDLPMNTRSSQLVGGPFDGALWRSSHSLDQRATLSFTVRGVTGHYSYAGAGRCKFVVEEGV